MSTRAFEYQSRTACPCGGELSAARAHRHLAHAWGALTFAQCPACGSWCQAPQITAASLASWYDSDEYQGSAHHAGSVYANYAADEVCRRREAKARYARDLRPWLVPNRPARILEIGCASGSLLAELQQAGHEVTGVDLSPRFAELARRQGINLMVGDFLTVSLPSAHFDLILMFGTASNLPDLPRALERIRSLMAPGGLLIFNFPAADSLIARLYGASFWMFAPSVSTFATRLGMTAALARVGLEMVETRVDRQMPSLSKMLVHSKVGRLLPFLHRSPEAGRGWMSPVRLPIPGVRIAWVRAGLNQVV